MSPSERPLKLSDRVAPSHSSASGRRAALAGRPRGDVDVTSTSASAWRLRNSRPHRNSSTRRQPPVSSDDRLSGFAVTASTGP